MKPGKGTFSARTQRYRDRERRKLGPLFDPDQPCAIHILSERHLPAIAEKIVAYAGFHDAHNASTSCHQVDSLLRQSPSFVAQLEAFEPLIRELVRIVDQPWLEHRRFTVRIAKKAYLAKVRANRRASSIYFDVYDVNVAKVKTLAEAVIRTHLGRTETLKFLDHYRHTFFCCMGRIRKATSPRVSDPKWRLIQKELLNCHVKSVKEWLDEFVRLFPQFESSCRFRDSYVPG